MNASLLSAVQTEPWSLVLLGAVLLALSSIARRKSPVAAAATVTSSDAISVARTQAAAMVQPRPVERTDAPSRGALRPLLESGLNTAS